MNNTTLTQSILEAISELDPSYGELLHVIGVNKGLFWSDMDYQQDLISHRERVAF